MHVEPESFLEHGPGHHEPVRDGDYRRRTQLESGDQALELQDGNPEPLGDLLRRGRDKPAPTPGRSVGPRQDTADLGA